MFVADEWRPCVSNHLDQTSTVMKESFPALTGFYKLLFLYIEPASTIIPAFIIGFYPGVVWFHNELVLGSKPALSLEPAARMALWQLASCETWLLPVNRMHSLTGDRLRSVGNDFVTRISRCTRCNQERPGVYTSCRLLFAFTGRQVAQERVVGSLLIALAVADLIQYVRNTREYGQVTHMLEQCRCDGARNARRNTDEPVCLERNIYRKRPIHLVPFCLTVCSHNGFLTFLIPNGSCAWFKGIGRKTFYYSVKVKTQ